MYASGAPPSVGACQSNETDASPLVADRLVGAPGGFKAGASADGMALASLLGGAHAVGVGRHDAEEVGHAIGQAGVIVGGVGGGGARLAGGIDSFGIGGMDVVFGGRAAFAGGGPGEGDHGVEAAGGQAGRGTGRIADRIVAARIIARTRPRIELVGRILCSLVGLGAAAGQYQHAARQDQPQPPCHDSPGRRISQCAYSHVVLLPAHDQTHLQRIVMGIVMGIEIRDRVQGYRRCLRRI